VTCPRNEGRPGRSRGGNGTVWLWIALIANDGAIGMPANTAATGEETQISDTVRLRLRALVRCLDDGPCDDTSEQMLMDVDLDGQRYLLIRMPAVMPKGVSLSPREVEIVRLVAAGHQNKVIASVLEISSWTVCTHMRRVFAKFGVTSRAAMVARVAALGGIMDGMLPNPRGRPHDDDDPGSDFGDGRETRGRRTPALGASSAAAPSQRRQNGRPSLKPLPARTAAVSHGVR
jgi:DNA-binding CsgD family transcriptional regulator